MLNQLNAGTTAQIDLQIEPENEETSTKDKAKELYEKGKEKGKEVVEKGKEKVKEINKRYWLKKAKEKLAEEKLKEE